MAAKKPVRTFTGTEGIASTGANGPDALRTDIETLTIMCDPLLTHGDGTPGGIHKDNLQTSSGILTEDDNVILEDGDGDLSVTRDVEAGRDLIATRNVAGVAGNFSGTVTAPGFSGPLTGNVAGNCSGSSGSCTGNAATADLATNAVNATNSNTLGGYSPDENATNSTVPIRTNKGSLKCTTLQPTNGIVASCKQSYAPGDSHNFVFDTINPYLANVENGQTILCNGVVNGSKIIISLTKISALQIRVDFTDLTWIIFADGSVTTLTGTSTIVF